jgi:FtsP/CotA-like multicopper oxidase with cupredoxin domain
MVPAQPTAGFPANWPTDGRKGGVPDPATAGPDIVQIGNEGGLLPELAIHKAQPVLYETNVRSITVFNILENGLLLMGGERADVLIDFSKYAGQTLILYNDAPSPMPGFDPRIDYFTGDSDLTSAGGAYSTLPGYGPNTRTVMQIKVNNTTPAKALDTAALAAALPVAYAATQPKPIVPEVVYNKPFGTTEGNNYAKITTGSGVQPTFSWTANGIWSVNGATIVNGGSGYTKPPIVTFSPPPANTGKANPGKTATGTATIDATGKVTAITLDTLPSGNLSTGNGYVATPIITLTQAPGDTTGKGAVAIATTTATKTVNVINKAIQELFDPIYGRMNATLAVELPFSTALLATTIPLNYVDAPYDNYDVIKDGETQIWKITHNGVDSHPVHFHLVNVQVINRVGWDGTIKPPHGNELGWKETLRMNPLEDIIVAVTASRPVTPFSLPKSKRLLDPSQSAGGTLGFTQIDPVTGQAPAIPFSNVTTDFDNEYVWHCHILGHEENDFMRPFVFRPDVVVPDAPGNVTVTGTTVTWTDPTPLNGVDSLGAPTAGTNAAFPSPTNSSRNEIGFRVYATGSTSPVATLPANVTSWTDASVSAANTYTVTAYNAAGEGAAGSATTLTSGGAGTVTSTSSTASSAASVTQAIAAANAATTAAAVTAATPAAPTGLTQTLNPDGTVTISWNAVAGATNYIVTAGKTIYPQAGQPLITGTSLTIAVSNSSISVVAVNNAAALQSVSSASLYNGAAATPTNFSARPGKVGSVALTWSNNNLNVNNLSGFTLSWVQNAATKTLTFAPNSTGATIIKLTSGGSYTFTLQANSSIGNSASVSSTVTAP